MISAGVCSVTFRSLSIEEVTALARECGLGAIEWGSDRHVPPGDGAAARRAHAASEGLELSYGSYLFASADGVADDEIATVLDTAVTLGAPNVRVWCPFGIEPGSHQTRAVAEQLVVIASAAAQRQLTVGLEFHGGTLTASAESAALLLDAVDAPNLRTYWQPPYWLSGRSPEDDSADIELLGARISNLHVYQWADNPNTERRPLCEGRSRWLGLLRALVQEHRLMLLEFVANDDPEQFRRDAQTMLSIIEEAA